MREFFLILPEVCIVLTLAFVIAGEITHSGERIRLIGTAALIGIAGALIQTIISYGYGPTKVFGGSLSIDGFSLFFKLVFMTLGMLAIFLMFQSKEIAVGRRTEYIALVLASILSMCLVASASDLVVAFLALLFMNLISYVLAAYGQKSAYSAEAGIKFLAFGAVSSALLLYGFAILFASTHTLNLYEMHQALLANPLSFEVMWVVFSLCFLAFSFQLGTFPMYLLVPDVLEGAPTPVSAFLSIGPRAAGFALVTRLLIVLFAQPGAVPGRWEVLGEMHWTQIVSLVSGITMIVGALLAFRQQGAKRLVSDLVVAESGFLLMGLLVLDEVGIAALLYNLVVQLFALIGIFFILGFLVDELQSDRLVCMRGMLKRAVPECICLILFLFCLVGSPPLPGFIGKFTLIGSAIRHKRLALAGVAIFSMVLSIASVTRLSYDLISPVKGESPAAVPVSYSRKTFLAFLIIPMALVGIFANFVLGWAGRSLGFIFR
ncbi:MAG: NADH-quinone oxidoreductase subunit N [Bdellovibrionia bacterium]